MHQLVAIAVAVVALAGDAGVLEFQDSKEARGPAKAAKIVPTKTEAALKFFVIEKDKGPVKGVVVRLTSEAGGKYYTEETDGEGYGEVLVPVGHKYEVTYLSLGLARGDIVATLPVTTEPRQSIKLTLRYKRLPPSAPVRADRNQLRHRQGDLRPSRESRLDIVVEFMQHKKSARVEVSGHTDNVGNPKTNKALSAKRAQAAAPI